MVGNQIIRKILAALIIIAIWVAFQVVVDSQNIKDKETISNEK